MENVFILFHFLLILGPVCYKKGGPLAVTDCNLALGRLLPDYFPKIFGPNEDETLDKKATLKAFSKLTEEVSFLHSIEAIEDIFSENICKYCQNFFINNCTFFVVLFV